VTFRRITIFPSSRKDSRLRIHERDYFDEVQILVIPCNWGRSTVGIISGIFVDVTALRHAFDAVSDARWLQTMGKSTWSLGLILFYPPSRIRIVCLADLHLELAQDASIFCKKQGTNVQKESPSEACTNIFKHRFRPFRSLEKSSHEGSICRKPMLRKQLQEVILRKLKQQRKLHVEKLSILPPRTKW
jgi:hypothetical protein